MHHIIYILFLFYYLSYLSIIYHLELAWNIKQNKGLVTTQELCLLDYCDYCVYYTIVTTPIITVPVNWGFGLFSLLVGPVRPATVDSRRYRNIWETQQSMMQAQRSHCAQSHFRDQASATHFGAVALLVKRIKSPQAKQVVSTDPLKKKTKYKTSDAKLFWWALKGISDRHQLFPSQVIESQKMILTEKKVMRDSPELPLDLLLRRSQQYYTSCCLQFDLFMGKTTFL